MKFSRNKITERNHADISVLIKTMIVETRKDVPKGTQFLCRETNRKLKS